MPNLPPNNQKDVRNLMATGEPIGLSQLYALGISRSSLNRVLRELTDAGEIRRVHRGVYQLATETDSADSWVLATRAMSEGVLCLLSALAFHQLGTQMPTDVWIALPKSAYRPKVDYPPVWYVHFSGDAFSTGIEEHQRQGGKVRVYSVAKTLADCFKFRNQIGLDVAIEALKDAWLQRRVSINDLMSMAKICRVESVIKPYIETLLNE